MSMPVYLYAVRYSASWRTSIDSVYTSHTEAVMRTVAFDAESAALRVREALETVVQDEKHGVRLAWCSVVEVTRGDEVDVP